MYEVLLETYELISKLEAMKPVFGLQERLFLTQIAFHSENMENITSLAEQIATEKRELTTGHMNPELRKLKDSIEEKEMIETWNLMEECMNLQEGVGLSFAHMEKLYKQMTEEYKAGRQQADSKETVKKMLQALEMEVKKVQSSLEKAGQAWESFFRCEDCMKAVKRYLKQNPDSLRQRDLPTLVVKNQSR